MSHYDILLAKKLSGGGGGGDDSPFELVHRSAEYAVGDIVSGDDGEALGNALNSQYLAVGIVIDSNGNKYSPCQIGRFQSWYTVSSGTTFDMIKGQVITRLVDERETQLITIRANAEGAGIFTKARINAISYSPIPTGVTLEKFYFETYKYNFE